jgi:hypothetical protein
MAAVGLCQQYYGLAIRRNQENLEKGENCMAHVSSQGINRE